jgi:Multimeric flavodoxin WrbA
MKILIISGTPNKDGLCQSLVTAAFETAVQSGAEADIVNLADFGLSSCKMCGNGWGKCLSENCCEYGGEDGFDTIQSKCGEADAFVLVTPVYYREPSEAFKAFMSRIRRCESTKNRSNGNVSFFANKPSILVASAGGGVGMIVALAEIERALDHMGGVANPPTRNGIYDYIAVNSWNKEYKRDTLKAAVASLVKSFETANI